MKRLDKKYILVAIVIIIILVVIFVLQKSFALDFLSSGTSSLQVKYGEYDELPKNYVHIPSLDLTNAEFTTTTSAFKIYDNTNDQLSSQDAPKSERFHRIFYYGDVNYGAANRTNTTDAIMTDNNITGSFSLMYKNAAILSDGEKADVKVTISNVSFKLGANSNNKSGKVYVSLLNSNGPELYTSVTSPNKTIRAEDMDESTKTHINMKMKFTISVLDSTTGQPINSKYEQMLFGMKDIDVADNSLAYTAKDLVTRFNGEYAEGAELLTGFANSVVFAPTTGPNVAMRNLLQVKNKNGNMRIQGDGNLYQAKLDLMPDSPGDNETYYSGFIVPVNPQGFSFNWYGMGVWSSVGSMGTGLYGIPNVSVTATSGEGGTIEKPGVTSYNLNSMTTYDYTPAHGYKVKTLKVNGEDVGFSEEGGTYTFRKLYKTPLIEINNDGTKGAPLGEDYTIDVRFEEKDKIKVKYVTDKNGSIDKTAENVIEKDSPLGIVDTPNTGYKLLYIKCDKPVKLTDGTVILKDNPMTLEQLKKIIVEEPLVCTVVHKKDNTKTYNCED